MNAPFPALWPAPDRSAERVALAEAVVRAERALARQAARIAAGSRIAAVRYVDTLTVLALLLPWTSADRAGEWPGLTRNGLQVSGWVASVALMSVVLRQIVLTAVAAQPDGRARYGLLGVGVVTGGASISSRACSCRSCGRRPVRWPRSSPRSAPGLLVPIALGAGAALALLTSSSLYETLHRDRLAPDAVGAAHVWLDAALRPPEVEYYI